MLEESEKKNYPIVGGLGSLPIYKGKEMYLVRSSRKHIPVGDKSLL